MLAGQSNVERQARLLEAAAKVGHAITSLLDLNALFSQVVDIICDTYGFYYAGIFLLDPHQPGYAVLRAGRGEIGRKLVEQGHKLDIGDTSMIGWCISHKGARITADVRQDRVHRNVPSLPETRSEMALPLIVAGEVIGALTIQSAQNDAFQEIDLTSLQAMADQLAIAIENARTHTQAQRRARLLQLAAEVGRDVTSILVLDELLPKTVDLICQAYEYYYAAAFLTDESGEWALLHAGYGEPGRVMLERGHKLRIADESMIGWCVNHKEARIALDVGQEAVRFNNPYLPQTRSEMALPLIVGDKVIGALSIQSAHKAAFSQDDITSLQAMADLLAVAIQNAQLLTELEKAHHELVRTKTFEAIATSTGEAIHWIGNKATPILTTSRRLRGDVAQFAAAAGKLLDQLPQAEQDSTLAQLVRDFAGVFDKAAPEAPQAVDALCRMPIAQARRRLDAESVNEDLEIIDESARLIVAVRDGLIGPTREHKPHPAMIQDVLQDTIVRLGIPWSNLTTNVAPHTPLVLVDTTQISRVFANLLCNAMEAMQDTAADQRQITVGVRPASDAGMVEVTITDNGCGIPAENLDKIWVTFYTTKDSKQHPGLGLAACLQVVQQMDGQISVQSQVGAGATFTILLPAVSGNGKGELPAGSQTILILDDDDEWRQFAQAALEKAGYRVLVTAQPGHLNIDPSMRVIVDQNLQQAKSLDVLRALPEAVLHSVIVVTSNLVVEQATDLLQAGAEDVTLKPYTIQELAALLQG